MSPAAVAGKGIFDLQGKTVESIGFGLIGQAATSRIKSFGVDFLYYDKQRVSEALEAELKAFFTSLNDLLRCSDIVTIHIPLTHETRHLIGKTEFQKMKKSAILINTARGAVVDEEALVEALNQGIIAGAGLYVFSEEPLPQQHPLRRCQNVLLSPHLAGQTREAMERMVSMMLENIGRVMRGEELLYKVNAP